MTSPKLSVVKVKRAKKRAADLADIAFERLWQMILNGELKEGAKVRERRLANEFSIGITPIREAVRRIAALGYLILKPNHAPVVRKLSAEDIRQIYALRAVLECFAIRSTWNTLQHIELGKLEKLIRKVENTIDRTDRLRTQLELDSELHSLWCSSKNNPWLSSSLERLLIYRPNLMSVLATHGKFVDQAYIQHRSILCALKKRDVAKTIKLLRNHIETSGSVLATLTSS